MPELCHLLSIVMCPMGRVLLFGWRPLPFSGSPTQWDVYYIQVCSSLYVWKLDSGSCCRKRQHRSKFWESMTNPCLSQAHCHSTTTVSVIWLLALDFFFSMCIPLPGNFNIGCCANEKLLRLVAHRRVHWSWGQGGLIEPNFRFEKYCDPGDSWMYLLNK